MKKSDFGNLDFLGLIKALRDRESSRELELINEKGFEAMSQSGYELLKTKSRFQAFIPISNRSNIEASSATAGEESILAIPPVADKTIFAVMGATVLTGLKNNVVIPSVTAPAISWKAQTDTSDDANPTLKSIKLAPLRLTAWLDVSSLLLLQGGPAASKYLADILLGAGAQALEETVLGVAARSAIQPQGIGYKITSGTDTALASRIPSFDDILDLETELAANKAYFGNKLAYLTSPMGKYVLKTTPMEAGHPNRLLEDGKMNDLPVYISNFASDIAGSDGFGSLLVLGNWADLVICQTGSYLITVDPISQARSYKTRILLDFFVDVKGLRGSLTTGEGTDDDEYNGSFASLPIRVALGPQS